MKCFLSRKVLLCLLAAGSAFAIVQCTAQRASLPPPPQKTITTVLESLDGNGPVQNAGPAPGKWGVANTNRSPASVDGTSPDTMSDEDMPAFPSDPPKPVQKYQLTSFFKRPEQTPSQKPIMAQLVLQIKAMLAPQDYDKTLRYFRFRNHGFAIATQVERFDEASGKHDTSSQRFVAALTSEPQAQGLLDYLRRMISGKQGQYRMFVILATNETYTYSKDPISAEVKRQITDGGADSLTDGILNGVWAANVQVELLVYEFEKLEGRTASLASAPRNASWHFEKSGLLAAARLLPSIH